MGTLKKKDFEKIAKIIKDWKDNYNLPDVNIKHLVINLSEYLKTTNGQFKEKEFRLACGLQPTERVTRTKALCGVEVD